MNIEVAASLGLVTLLVIALLLCYAWVLRFLCCAEIGARTENAVRNHRLSRRSSNSVDVTNRRVQQDEGTQQLTPLTMYEDMSVIPMASSTFVIETCEVNSITDAD
jgi:hypothetical protein